MAFLVAVPILINHISIKHHIKLLRLRPYNVLKALLYLSTISDVPCDTTLENYRVTCTTSPIFSIFLTTAQQQRPLPECRHPLGAHIQLPKAPRSIETVNPFSHIRVVASDVICLTTV